MNIISRLRNRIATRRIASNINKVRKDARNLRRDAEAVHAAEYHPGLRCAENTDGDCLDQYGGTPATGPSGQHRPAGRQ